MSNVDVAALAAELRALVVGGRLEKAYQPAKDVVLLRMRPRSGGRVDLLFRLGKFLTPTRRPPENPSQPSMVAQILRNTLGNGRIVAVGQVGFDRVLRIDVERPEGVFGLIFELFGDGNLLFLDPDGTIRLPMRGEDFKHRSLRKGEPYVPPPAGPHPLHLQPGALAELGAKAEKDLVRFLALDLGLGPVWAEEMCLRAALPRATRPADMGKDQWAAVHRELQQLAADIQRNDLAPGVVLKAGEPVDAVPFPMQRYPAPEFAYEEAPMFWEALDRFFVGSVEEEEEEDPRRGKFEEARGRLQRQVDQIEGAMSGFLADEQRERADGDAIYASFQEVQQILDQLHRARLDRSWEAVESILAQARAAGDEAAAKIPELRPHEGMAVFRLTDAAGATRDVEVDLRLNVQENAERHYAASKKARSRRDGAEKALAEARERVRALEAKGLDGFGAAPTRVVRDRRHFWFETYRWTLLPSGLVAVGGRNASQNDAVVKKYLRDGDRYVHAEIHGAPSVVVRPVDGPPVEVADEDLAAACQFAACSSRAWRQFGEASAYWVTAQQVSKTPRSGEFVPKGAWIVHGRRNVVSGLPMQWAVGLVRFLPGGGALRVGQSGEREVVKVVGGPPACLQPFCDNPVRIAPGDMDANEAAARLAEVFGVDIQEVQAALPPGGVTMGALP
jgi:predicted ribosome quality control (RQC) complex YloA/Tae2 family protein